MIYLSKLSAHECDKTQRCTYSDGRLFLINLKKEAYILQNCENVHFITPKMEETMCQSQPRNGFQSLQLRGQVFLWTPDSLSRWNWMWRLECRLVLKVPFYQSPIVFHCKDWCGFIGCNGWLYQSIPGGKIGTGIIGFYKSI